MPTRPPLLTTRRTAMGGALIALTGAGCSLERPADPADRAAGTPTPTASTAARAASRDEDPDAALVDDVLAELRSLDALASGVATRFPRWRAEARALSDLHRAHREALGDEVAAGSEVADARGLRRLDPAGALRVLRTRELRAQRRLVDWSVAAESGALARLLAAMSAGVAQRVAVLPAASRARGAGR